MNVTPPNDDGVFPAGNPPGRRLVLADAILAPAAGTRRERPNGDVGTISIPLEPAGVAGQLGKRLAV